MPGNWGRAGDGLRVSVTVVLNPQGPGRTGWGGGAVAEPWKEEEQSCLWFCLKAGLGCCRGKLVKGLGRLKNNKLDFPNARSDLTL